jgi:hypothetical protein
MNAEAIHSRLSFPQAFSLLQHFKELAPPHSAGLSKSGVASLISVLFALSAFRSLRTGMQR